jgi:hypothetical protein
MGFNYKEEFERLLRNISDAQHARDEAVNLFVNYDFDADNFSVYEFDRLNEVVKNLDKEFSVMCCDFAKFCLHNFDHFEIKD